MIREYYAKVPDDPNHRKHVLAKAIRPKYGNFPFGNFGFGTFIEFSRRHGLEVYNAKGAAPPVAGRAAGRAAGPEKRVDSAVGQWYTRQAGS